MKTFSGRVVLVTGASRGIGRAIALRLAECGASVVAGARGQHADGVAAEAASMGRTIVSVNLDVTDADEVRNAVQLVLQKFGRIDILVNNAGIARDQLALRMKPVEWGIVIDTNLTAAFTCCQAVLRSMLKQRSGRIINVSSVVGQSGNPGQANYAASKAGLVGLTKSLALEVASRGITVNAVAPGMVDTDMMVNILSLRSEQTGKSDTELREFITSEIPLGRMNEAKDIVELVVFLAGPGSRNITGQSFNIDGGMIMQ